MWDHKIADDESTLVKLELKSAGLAVTFVCKAVDREGSCDSSYIL